MIVVCTKDPAIINWTLNDQSGANQWGNVIVINAMADQDYATTLFAHALSLLGVDEPLCFNSHGNNVEIGDAGNGPLDWTWNVNQIAALLIGNVPNGYTGPILIKSCASQISNFSARLAVSLQNGQGLNGVWIFGYNLPPPITQSFPAPATLAAQADLQGSQVVF